MNSKPQFPPGFSVWIDGVQVPKDDVMSPSFEDGLKLMDELKVVIRNDRMKYTKEHNKLRGAKIKLEGGWIGREWDTLFTGRIYRANPTFAEDNTIDIAALPVDVSDGWHDKKTVEHKGDSLPDIIKNVVLSSHPTLKVLYDIGSAAARNMGIIQDNETDWEFCKRLAGMAGGKEFTIKGDTAIIRDPKPTEAQAVTFEYGKNVSSLSVIESDIKKAKSSKVSKESDKNSVRTETVEVSIEDQRAQEQYAALGMDRAYDGGAVPSNQQYNPSLDEAGAQDSASGNGKDSATDEIKINLRALGTIKAVAGKTAIVKGYGYLDGKYYIRKVTHTWSDSYLIAVELSNKQPKPEGESDPNE